MYIERHLHGRLLQLNPLPKVVSYLKSQATQNSMDTSKLSKRLASNKKYPLNGTLGQLMKSRLGNV